MLLPEFVVIDSGGGRGRRRGNYGCFFFHEKLVLEIGLGCCIPPASFLMFKLIAVDDALGIRPEIFSVLVGSIAAGGENLARSEQPIGGYVFRALRCLRVATPAATSTKQRSFFSLSVVRHLTVFSDQLRK